MEPFVDETESGSSPVCSKSLKKYFYFAGVIAILILVGAYWYTGYYAQGFGFLGASSAAANMMPQTVPPGMGPLGTGPAAMGVQARRPAFPPAAISAPTPWAGGTNPAPTAAATGQDPQGFQAALAGHSGFSAVVMNVRRSVVNVTVSRSSGAASAPSTATVTQAPGAGGGDIQFATPLVGGILENMGSGVIIRGDGYILTNYHVVRGSAAAFVTVFDDVGTQRYSADVIKMDETLDLALLKITPKSPLSPAVLGDSDRILIAEEVITVGSPFGLDQTVSRGIVSGMRKALVIEGVTHANLIQTDAAINQGNSGGPLINLDGHVIGINTAIYTPTGAFSGIGFAIPSNHARRFVETEIVLPDSAVRAQLAAFPNQGGGAAPPIFAGMRPPHTDGRESLACASCHQILPKAGTISPVVWGQAVALPGQGGGAAPPIMANAPSPHTDGRGNCTACHQIIGGTGTMNPVAWGQAVAMPPQPPPIKAGVASPHTDGREALACTSCHQIIGGTGAMSPVAWGQAVAMPPQPPPIKAGVASPHTDGREALDCTSCHQIIGGAAVAFQYQFAKPPSSLAVNVANPPVPMAGAAVAPPQAGFAGTQAQTGVQAGTQMGGGGKGPGMAAGADVSVIGAVVHAITPTLGQRVGQAAGDGVFVASVVPGSAAAAAKLMPGDVIVKVDGRRVATPAQVANAVKTAVAGDVLRLNVARGGKRQDIKVILGAVDTGMNAAPMPNKPPPTEFVWLGVEIENFTLVMLSTDPQGNGVMGAMVNEVAPGSRAANAGIKVGDVILQVNNQTVDTPEAMDKAIRGVSKRPNNLVKISRNGAEIFVVI